MNKKLLNIFVRFNSLHWGNKLPIPDLIYSKKIKECGIYYYETEIDKKDYVIKINTNQKGEDLRKTMLHEMCHHAVYINNKKYYKPNSKTKIFPHGKEWKKEMRKVGFKGKISRWT